jgi:hypothetical protein
MSEHKPNTRERWNMDRFNEILPELIEGYGSDVLITLIKEEQEYQDEQNADYTGQ